MKTMKRSFLFVTGTVAILVGCKGEKVEVDKGLMVEANEVVVVADSVTEDLDEEVPVTRPDKPTLPLFGINLYHTTPNYWSEVAIPHVIEEVASCKGHNNIKSLRFFLPTLGDAPFDWQTRWLDTTYEFIREALWSGKFEQVHIVVGYGLDYHLSEDIASLLPDSPHIYVEAVSRTVEQQVRHVISLPNPYGTQICWQIENELDIAYRHEARPNREGFPWSDRSFIRELEKGLQKAVLEGTDYSDPCIYITMTPLSLGSRDIYPWEDSDFKGMIDFVGLHYYPFGGADVVSYMRDLIEGSIREIITTHNLPVMITEFGMRALTDDDGVVISGAEESRLWLREMISMVRNLKASREPVLGLLYFKWDDADPESEEACGYQGFMGFFKLGGEWFNHQEKVYPPERGECPGPLACWCEHIGRDTEP